MQAETIINNPHFQAFVPIIRDLDSGAFRRRNPRSKADFHFRMFRRMTVGTPGGDRPITPRTITQQAKDHALAMISHAVTDDPTRIRYSEADLQWLVEVLDTSNTLATSMIFAVASAPEDALDRLPEYP